jgi:hypothetical protein
MGVITSSQMGEGSAMAADKGGGGGRIPATLITGFLGSGKTTLVNRLLRERPGMAVLVNDFGEVPLDGDLIAGERVLPLADGCVCYGRSEDLVWALARFARGEPPGHLLLETSRLAHPGPVLATLASPGVKEAYRLAGVVTLADALHLEAHLAYPEAVAQLALADLISFPRPCNRVVLVPDDVQLALADLISFPRWTWPLEGRRPWTGSRR